MYLNQLLHDEQLALMRQAEAIDPSEVAAYRTLLKSLAEQISAYPLVHHPYPCRARAG